MDSKWDLHCPEGTQGQCSTMAVRLWLLALKISGEGSWEVEELGNFQWKLPIFFPLEIGPEYTYVFFMQHLCVFGLCGSTEESISQV